MVTLVCVRHQKGASEADRRKGLDYVETGRREFDTRDTAKAWLASKAATLKAKGKVVIFHEEGERVDLVVIHDNTTTDFYRFA